MSFMKSTAALAEEGIKTRKAFKRRFKFTDKNRDRFYLRVVPIVEGFEPRAIPYHQNLGILAITNIHTKKVNQIYLNARCHDGKATCTGCLRSAAQKEQNPNFKSDAQFWRQDMGTRVGQFALVYECYLKENGEFEYKKENNLPQLIEYNYKWGTCEDWDQLIDVMSEIQAQGVDPTDPVNGFVIRVEKKKVAAKKGNTLRTVYQHTSTGKVLALPQDWEQAVTGHDKITNTHFDFTAEDLEVILGVHEAMKQVQADATKTEAQKASELSELTELFKGVSNKDFVDLVDAFHTKEPDNKKNDGASAARPSTNHGALAADIHQAQAEQASSYARTAEASLSAPQTVASAPSAEPVAAPAVNPQVGGALARLRKYQAGQKPGGEGGEGGV